LEEQEEFAKQNNMNTIEKDEVFGNKNQLTGETVEEISFEKNITDWENEGIDIHD
jgi:hypothetical protein